MQNVKSLLIRSALISTACLCTYISNAQAAVTFNYTGNTLTQTSTDLVGKRLLAQVTFTNAVINFTGRITAPDVEKWTIEIEGAPATRMSSEDSFNDSEWPLWFDFSNGEIASWQLLAHTTQDRSSTAEIFTTNRSPYSRIYPTEDYYTSDSINSSFGLILDSPGTWSAAPIPEPSTLFLMTVGALVLGRRKLRLLQNAT